MTYTAATNHANGKTGGDAFHITMKHFLAGVVWACIKQGSSWTLISNTSRSQVRIILLQSLRLCRIKTMPLKTIRSAKIAASRPNALIPYLKYA